MARVEDAEILALSKVTAEEFGVDDGLYRWPCGCLSPIAGGDVVVPCDECADPSTPGLGPDDMPLTERVA